MTQQQTQVQLVVAEPSQAYQWGKEDALTGEDNRASEYFRAGTPEFEDYLDGYASGIEQRKQEAEAQGDDSEESVLNAALDGLRKLNTNHPAYAWVMATDEPITFERASGYW